jgi:hypothetical protein
MIFGGQKMKKSRKKMIFGEKKLEKGGKKFIFGGRKFIKSRSHLINSFRSSLRLCGKSGKSRKDAKTQRK